jgi:DNA repair exonuclease SbcCD ATPase subunit
MRITRLQLHEFGRHRDLDIELSSGFTIIRGPNEAGKSTIQRGLELALFRKPTATTGELDTLRSWGAGQDDRSATRIEFVVDDEVGATGQITTRHGVLEKDFRGQRGRVALQVGDEMFTDPARAEEVIAELTGVPNEAFFRSTASIRHQEMEDLDRDEGALRDRLQASIGGGDKGSSRAKARLEDAIRGLKSRGDKNPGRLKIAEEAVSRAEQALKSGEAALQKLESDRDALARARDLRVRSEVALGESRNLLEAARQAERLRTDRAVVAERFERYRQAAEAQQRLQELEAMPERSISSLRDQLERLRTLQSRVSVMKDTLREDLGPEIEPDEVEPTFMGTGLVAAGLFLAGVAAIAVGVIAFLPIVIVGAIIVLVALFAFTRFWERRSVAVNVRRLNESRQRDRTLRRQGRVGTEEGVRVAQSGVQNILRELGVPDVAAAERLMTTEQSRRQEIATLQVQVSALVAGQGGGGVTDLRDRAALEMEQKTSALDSLGPLAGDARARERLEAEVRDRHAALERARDSEAGAIARVEANPVDAEQVAGEAERLVTWRDQLAALQRRVRIYETTLAGVTAAEGLTMRKATRFLEQQVGRDIAKLTGGRYHRVSIDDQTLDIDVWAPERNDWVPASRLSKGTIDQVFLAARIGLVRLVTQGRRPPLILDDPFVTFDDARAARAALLLRELSADFQVIYLATTNRYDGLADSVVELPGPTEVQAQAQAPAPAPTEAPRPEAFEDEAPVLISVSDDAPVSGEEVAESAEPTDAEAEVAEPAAPADVVEPDEIEVEAEPTEPAQAVEPTEVEPTEVEPTEVEPTEPSVAAEPHADADADADAGSAEVPSVIQFPFLRPAEGEDDDEMAGDADLDGLPSGPVDRTARTFSGPVETPGDRGQ